MHRRLNTIDGKTLRRHSGCNLMGKLRLSNVNVELVPQTKYFRVILDIYRNVDQKICSKSAPKQVENLEYSSSRILLVLWSRRTNGDHLIKVSLTKSQDAGILWGGSIKRLQRWDLIFWNCSQKRLEQMINRSGFHDHESSRLKQINISLGGRRFWKSDLFPYKVEYERSVHRWRTLWMAP